VRYQIFTLHYILHYCLITTAISSWRPFYFGTDTSTLCTRYCTISSLYQLSQ